MTSQAISSELREWVVTQLAAGHSIHSLRASMRDAGWHDDAVDAALAGSEAQAAGLATVAVTRTSMPGPDLSNSPLYIDAGDRRVQVLQTLRHPRVVVFGDLLSDDECEDLIQTARQRLARSLTVETQTGGEALNVDRTSDGMFFERGENPVVARLEQRIALLLRWPLEFGEGLQVLRYSPGAQYRPHYDYFDPAEPGTPTILRRGGQRVATLVMYLQEPGLGGATTFPDVGLEVAPKRGTGVFFSYERPDPATHTLHGGAPVLAGEKWVATKWLREREFR
ncbi:2OG-Fe(II) oxygenase superfamily protein [Variovorax sp. PBS-H4]|uniref:2OG-Fe(II) oxygenase n=1 Tax=Variovorax sp. PBS-H4 TaxID=434008 RepID=UPI001317B6CF|nr:2OG-Fe(II) oxygenase [Variovorax sp. PBS-H4]VTU39988.1 2OG-Fe(II) oxygenase superfamily protein [Variovorax sp. PBS-H4]